MSTLISEPGAVPAVPGPGPVPLPVAVSDPAAARGTRYERINDLLEGIVFYGLLLFGLSMPVIGAVYAFLIR
ncbi:MAG: hypothetical protein R3286_10585 [Gammaproteobacteria bacterium]|nr:hypothetical protein [Gammaproteobacteria bacterium]